MPTCQRPLEFAHWFLPNSQGELDGPLGLGKVSRISRPLQPLGRDFPRVAQKRDRVVNSVYREDRRSHINLPGLVYVKLPHGRKLPFSADRSGINQALSDGVRREPGSIDGAWIFWVVRRLQESSSNGVCGRVPSSTRFDGQVSGRNASKLQTVAQSSFRAVSAIFIAMGNSGGGKCF